jgi:hypothetical protein
MVKAQGTSGVTCIRCRIGRFPCRLAGADRERHAAVLSAAWTRRHHLAMGTEWAFSSARTHLLRAIRARVAGLHAFGAGVTVSADGDPSATVAVDRADFPAGAIAEALLAARTGAGNVLAAGAGEAHRVAAQGTVLEEVTVHQTGLLHRVWRATGPTGAELAGGTTAARTPTTIIATHLAAAARGAGCGWG